MTPQFRERKTKQLRQIWHKLANGDDRWSMNLEPSHRSIITQSIVHAFWNAKCLSLLKCSHRSLVRLDRTARFARAFCCADLFACSLTSELVRKCDFQFPGIRLIWIMVRRMDGWTDKRADEQTDLLIAVKEPFHRGNAHITLCTKEAPLWVGLSVRLSVHHSVAPLHLFIFGGINDC